MNAPDEDLALPPAAPNSLSFTIPGRPQAWQRAQLGRARGRRIHFTEPRTANAKYAAQGYMLEARAGYRIWPAGVALELRLLVVFACPAGDLRKRSIAARRWNTKRPDWDNLAKLICDAGNSVLWHDDSQIARVVFEKVIGGQHEEPAVHVAIRVLTGERAPSGMSP